MHTRKAKFFNPKTQKWQDVEVLLDKKLNYDYTNSKWIAIDGEFTGLYPLRDKSTLWTVASEDESGNPRVEMLYTYDDDADISTLKELITSDREKLLFFGKLDIAYLYQLTGEIMTTPLFDVKISSLVARTHTAEHGLRGLIQTYVNKDENIIDKTGLDNSDWVTDFTTWSDATIQYNVNDVIYLKFLSEKIKEISKKIKREQLVKIANNTLSNLAILYASGFYKDIFSHGYRDADMVS